MASTPPREDWELLRASEIGRGECFVKRTAGAHGFAYIAVGFSGMRATQLTLEEGFIYGVCYNGGITKVSADTLVWKVPFTQMDINRGIESLWDRAFAGMAGDL